jgi:hypothetical protein
MMSAVVATNPSDALWRIAVSEYEREAAAYAVVCADYEAAMRADGELSLRARCAEFEPFQPINFHHTEDAIRLVYAKLYKDRPIVDKDAPGATDAERAELFAKASKIVADYAKLSGEMDEALDRIYGDSEKRHDEACGKVSVAREKLFSTPAPDAASLLYKLEILMNYLNDCESEDEERVAAVAADVRRMLGAE